MTVQKRKLIEVALPLEAINRESAREKSIRHGHPSTLHLWWARRPLAAARAVLFAQLVDDPSSHPERFPTEEDQRVERERLHHIIERLVVWENISDEALYAEAHAEIMASTDNNPPPILDPFAGGGTIPLEAQRLGLEAHASDLNPVAVLINKALIEIPPKFRDQPPVFPGLADTRTHWKGAEGLAADVRAYGGWMRDEAEKRIGHLYPKATLPDGSKATVIAWIWARTVTCPNPACGIEMPLVRSWWLGKKKGKEAYVVPRVFDDPSATGGKRVSFTIGHDMRAAPDIDGTVGRTGAKCVSCDAAVDLAYIRSEGRGGRVGATMMAMVAEGQRKRVYLPADIHHVQAADVPIPVDAPDQSIPPKAPSFRVQAYGMTSWADLFTARQLVGLTTFSSAVALARSRVLADTGSVVYSDAVATYLGFVVSRLADYQSTITTWASNPQMEILRNIFARQAIPMTWDFGEGNPFAESSGSLLKMTASVSSALARLPAAGRVEVSQEPAQSASVSRALISTDPPYYDNIGYSDLSDFFYVWLRHCLQSIYPQLLDTVLVPKAEELVANPFRHDGTALAREFFENGFRQIFAKARKSAHVDFPITVYYAFKQSDTDEMGEGSTGWETLLDGMVAGGWEITSTWPMRTESAGRMLSVGTNALASSIVLSLRPRSPSAQTADRRTFISALESELPDTLRTLQQSPIAPVDLPQAAIGPGMAVYSRYAAVVEADGSRMSVRGALSRINEALDQMLNEQEGDFDSASRFAIGWYRHVGYSTGDYGEAESMANARGVVVQALDRSGILLSRAGNVTLIKPVDRPQGYDVLSDAHISIWEALHHVIKVLEQDGIAPAGEFLRDALARPDSGVEADLVKELGHLLFRVAEGRGWTRDALSFNSVVTSWPDIVDASRSAQNKVAKQAAFDFEEESS